MYMFYIWLAILIIGLIVELIVEGSLVSVWFSVGALVPLFMSLTKNNSTNFIITEIIIFGVVTSLCLIFLRKIAKRLFFKNNNETTNMERYIGKTYKVDAVNEDKTQAIIKLGGILYVAIGENEETFDVLEKVEVKKFKGNKVIVEKKEK